jgi:hypothetical protein
MGKPVRILQVDDEAIIAMQMKMELQKIGYEVIPYVENPHRCLHVRSALAIMASVVDQSNPYALFLATLALRILETRPMRMDHMGAVSVAASPCPIFEKSVSLESTRMMPTIRPMMPAA